MIAKIKQFFEQYIVVTEDFSDADIEYQLRLASAALMLEVLYADHAFSEDEFNTLRNVLREEFDLNESVRIVTNGSLSFDGMVRPDAALMLERASLDGDRTALYAGKIVIELETRTQSPR